MQNLINIIGMDCLSSLNWAQWEYLILASWLSMKSFFRSFFFKPGDLEIVKGLLTNHLFDDVFKKCLVVLPGFEISL